MSPNAQKLVDLFQRNRTEHGRCWRKIRLDKIPKLFPDLSVSDVNDLIVEAIAAGKMTVCEMKQDEQRYHALKLTQYTYVPKRLR
jgi:hypothetical protein